MLRHIWSPVLIGVLLDTNQNLVPKEALQVGLAVAVGVVFLAHQEVVLVIRPAVDPALTLSRLFGLDELLALVVIDGVGASVFVFVLLLPLQVATAVIKRDEHAALPTALLPLGEPFVGGIGQHEVDLAVKVGVGLLFDLLASTIGDPDVLLPVEVGILPMAL